MPVATLAKSLLLAAALTAPAASLQAAPIYADTVISFTQGPVDRVLPGRSDPLAALGAADGGFVSLGFGGSIVLGFAAPFRSMGEVFEVTFGNKNRHVESADVFVGNGSGWTLVASLQNTLSLAFGFVGTFTQLRIVDTSNRPGATFDGFDVDAVAVEAVEMAPVPLPAAGLLLSGALMGLGALRRRTRRARFLQAQPLKA